MRKRCDCEEICISGTWGPNGMRKCVVVFAPKLDYASHAIYAVRCSTAIGAAKPKRRTSSSSNEIYIRIQNTTHAHTRIVHNFHSIRALKLIFFSFLLLIIIILLLDISTSHLGRHIYTYISTNAANTHHTHTHILVFDLHFVVLLCFALLWFLYVSSIIYSFPFLIVDMQIAVIPHRCLCPMPMRSCI